MTTTKPSIIVSAAAGLAANLRSMPPGARIRLTQMAWTVRYDGKRWWVGEMGIDNADDVAAIMIDAAGSMN